MARRLLGADSATVFNVQEPEEEAANQVRDPPSFPGEQSVLRPPPPASLGTRSWRQLCAEPRVGLRLPLASG